jgi:hypothetical protein
VVALLNVFLIERGPDGRPDPVASARSLCDVHLRSQIKEAAQLLCTAAADNGVDETPYTPTYRNHVVTKWVTRGDGPWVYTRDHAKALMYEYMKAFGKAHRSSIVAVWAGQLDLKGFRKADAAPFCLAIPKKLRDIEDPVEAYQTYYIAKEFSWACKIRRAHAACGAIGWSPPSGNPFPASVMSWTGEGRRRPEWMPLVPVSTELTDDERELCKSLPQPGIDIMSERISTALGMYIRLHGEEIDRLLGIPETEAVTRGEFDLAAASYNGSMSHKNYQKYMEV